MDDFSCIIDVQMFVPSAWSTAHDEFTYTSLRALYGSILESPCSMCQWRSASGSVLVNYQGVNFGGKNTAKIHPRTSEMSCVFSQCTPHASRPQLGAALLSISGQIFFKFRIFSRAPLWPKSLLSSENKGWLLTGYHHRHTGLLLLGRKGQRPLCPKNTAASKSNIGLVC